MKPRTHLLSLLSLLTVFALSAQNAADTTKQEKLLHHELPENNPADLKEFSTEYIVDGYGTLIVYLESEISFSHYILLKNGVIIEKEQLEGRQTNIHLSTGKYDLQLFQDEKLVQTIYQIEIRKDHETFISTSYEIDIYSCMIDTPNYAYGMLEAKLLYGANHPFNTSPFNYDLNVGMNLCMLTNKRKYFHVGFLWGYDIKYTRLNSSRAQNFGWYEKERYTNFNLNFTVLSRISSYIPIHGNDKGFVFDVGATYKFPVVFRYVTVNENTRSITNKIHNYQNVVGLLRIGYLRIGYTPITATFEYRFFDYLKSPYPQTSKYSLGVSFYFLQEG